MWVQTGNESEVCLHAELCRLNCPEHGVRTEAVAFEGDRLDVVVFPDESQATALRV